MCEDYHSSVGSGSGHAKRPAEVPGDTGGDDNELQTRRVTPRISTKCTNAVDDLVSRQLNRELVGLQQLQDKTPKKAGFWDCLCCTQTNCGYESGITVMLEEKDGQEATEYDPCDPGLVGGRGEWNRNTALTFEKIRAPIKSLVQRCLRSKGIWKAAKFLGGPGLDKKVKGWMKMSIDQRVVEANYVPFRRAVQETLRFKRQTCTQYMKEAFMSESLVAGGDLSARCLLFFPNNSSSYFCCVLPDRVDGEDGDLVQAAQVLGNVLSLGVTPACLRADSSCRFV